MKQFEATLLNVFGMMKRLLKRILLNRKRIFSTHGENYENWEDYKYAYCIAPLWYYKSTLLP